MQCKKKLINLKKNEIWQFIPRPTNPLIIETKWVFRNKIDESGFGVRNKARLIAQDYSK